MFADFANHYPQFSSIIWHTQFSVQEPLLRYLPDFLSEEEERVLVEEISRLPFREIHMHGVVAKRTTAHYGWDYGYESWKLTPAPPVPSFLEPMREHCAAAAGLEPGP